MLYRSSYRYLTSLTVLANGWENWVIGLALVRTAANLGWHAQNASSKSSSGTGVHEVMHGRGGNESSHQGLNKRFFGLQGHDLLSMMVNQKEAHKEQNT
jgi:hypothetical protein